ncbi:MAG: glycosyltransferase [Candidatus Omnitrophota bacterium]|nr:glycosyltransferase [Candidatus Omnitrophota bacterium]
MKKTIDQSAKRLRSESEIRAAWGECSTPLVSIICTSYNHSKFIEEALDSFLIQKTTFPFEIIVFDDASTDSTQEIIEGYVKKYPNLFVPLLQKENLWQDRGVSGTVTVAYPNARGRYMAMCDGDDYWTDPLKLQKQVDYLDKFSEVSLCFHNAEIVNEEGSFVGDFHPGPDSQFLDARYIISQGWRIATASMMFRSKYLKQNMPSWLKYAPSGDYALHLLLSHYGYLYGLKDKMSVYRNNPNGLHVEFGKRMFFLKSGLKLLDDFDKETKGEYWSSIQKAKIRLWFRWLIGRYVSFIIKGVKIFRKKATQSS